MRSLLRKLFSRTPSPVARRPRRPQLRLEALEARYAPAVLTVDFDGGKQYTSIQAAINAAGTNDTISIYKATGNGGAYTETLNIPASKTGLKLDGAEAGVVLKAGTVGADFQGGDAIIDVRATKVEVRDLILDGTGANLNAGIRIIDGGSATVRYNTIQNITSSNSQFGLGVQVGGSSQGSITNVGTAKVENNTITGYSGAGVLVDASGSAADVRDNAITGRGAANAWAQYGVQVSFGATGRVEKNTISNNSSVNSGGVLFYEVAGKKNVVAKNDIDNNDIGIWLFATNGTSNGKSEVLNNDVTGSGFTGILVDSSNNASVKNNCVTGGDGDGIGVYDSHNTEIKNNSSSNNAFDGIYVFGGSCNEVKNNDAFCNGENGVATEDSSNNWLWNNNTWANGLNGVEILGGSGNDIWLSDSAGNVMDGILLQDTTCTTVIGNYLGCNGGYGLRLLNADNTFIALNLIQNNSAGSIFISNDSTGVVTVANRTDEAIEREAIGADAITASYLAAESDADALTADLV